MANNQTYVQGFGTDGGQITSLAHIQGNGLSLPSPTNDFIDIRRTGKLRTLFENNNNSEVLYSLKGSIENKANRFDYRNPNQGQRSDFNPKRTSLSNAAARRDASLIGDFIGSSTGRKHQLKQLLLQGFQPFDETKVYNPLSPRLAVLKSASFGLLDRPTRHIDTSNVVAGIIGGVGLGSLAGTIGGLLGKAPAAPAPPRSSVASEASGGLSLSTLTSLVGGGDKSSEVMRLDGGAYDVKGLLRGKTASEAYNSSRYSRLIPTQSSGGFFSKLLSGIGNFIQNNSLVGGLVPPKQPWGAKYRADEATYDYYLNSGKIFNPETSPVSGGGILSGLLNSIGFGSKPSYSSAVQQRFWNSDQLNPDGQRWVVVAPNTSVPMQRTNRVGKMQYDYTTTDRILTYETRPEQDKKYTDVVHNDEQAEIFYSDQLLNYESMVNKETYKNFNKKQFNDVSKNNFKDLFDNFSKGLRNIVGETNEKYKFGSPSANAIGNYFGGGDAGRAMWPLQFSRFESQQANSVGMKYLNETDFSNNKNRSTGNQSQQGRQIKSEESMAFPSLNLTKKSRKIRPTNDTDFVNSLGVLDSIDEYKNLNELTEKYGPDIVNFYFYDVINRKYIPFNATVQGLNENNQAEWETVEYLGRADKLYYYKGFTRTLNFNFKVVAHSVKELLPMWKRINHLVGLTRPANYTKYNRGYMISPLVQLTLGDIYKNHNAVITQCNVEIPDDASWETMQESLREDWYIGLSKAITWPVSAISPYAQFPREANINLNMNILEKDLPRTGEQLYGHPGGNFTAKLYSVRNATDTADPRSYNDGEGDDLVYPDSGGGYDPAQQGNADPYSYNTEGDLEGFSYSSSEGGGGFYDDENLPG